MDAHETMATAAAASATKAAWSSPPKSTIPLIVSATAVEMSDMPARPMKLQTTLMRMALSTSMARVPTGSAMALAASVAPFTKMMPRTSTITIARNGFDTTVSQNVWKLTTLPRYLLGHMAMRDVAASARMA